MNIYIEKVKSISRNSKYTNWYVNIILTAKNRAKSKKEANKILTYSEGHHILPKCLNMGGETDKENIAYLSAKEHFIVHMLLPKMFNEKYFSYLLSSAITLMMGKKNKYKNSNSYNTARKIQGFYQKFKTDDQKTLKTHYFLDSNNNLLEIKNLPKFCEENNLRYSSMVSVSNGTYKSHKNYKNTNYKEKIYSFVDPDGILYELNHDNLKHYCEQNNISLVNLRNMSLGHKDKYKGHQRKDIAKFIEIVTPENKEIKVYDILSFFTKRQINSSIIYQICRGERKSYKGYKLKKQIYVNKENSTRIKPNTVCCFDIIEKTFKRISKQEFEKYKYIKYVGQTSKIAKQCRIYAD